MHTTLENRKKARSISDFQRKNKVEKGRTLGSGMKREQESIDARAQKMMKGKVEPLAMPTMVRIVPTIVQATRHITEVPQMTSLQEIQLKEQR